MSEFKKSLIASSIATLVIHPLDVIRTQYQICLSSMKPNLSILVKNIMFKQGVSGFYKGSLSHLMTHPVFWSVFFQMKSYKFLILDNEMTNNVINNLICGWIASSIANPLFVLKTRKQSEILKNNINECHIKLIKNIWQNEGLKGFTKGLGLTIFGTMRLGIQFPLYDYLMELTDNVFLSSCFSKLISTSIFYPNDMIRTQKRNDNGNLKIKLVIKKIYDVNGLRGFYKGLILQNLASTPNFVLLMLIKDYLDRTIKSN